MVIEFLILDFYVDVDLNFLVLMEVSDKKKTTTMWRIAKSRDKCEEKLKNHKREMIA